MAHYITRRIIFLFFLLAAVTIGVFFIIHVLPGEPISGRIGKEVSVEDIQRIRHELKLDEPVIVQFKEYLHGLFLLDFGKSIYDGQTVWSKILIYLPSTVYLAIFAIVLTILISFPLGVGVALMGRERPVVSKVFTILGTLGLGLPPFLLGPMLIAFFSLELNWFRVTGTGELSDIVLPGLTLGISMSGVLTQIVWRAFETELKQPYILLARAKGLTQFRIFKNHLLKNAMIPIVTTMGMQFGALLGGAVITERVFSWKGIGSLLIESVQRRDYPMVQGIVLVITFFYLAVNFAVDISYCFIDPRVRYEK